MWWSLTIKQAIYGMEQTVKKLLHILGCFLMFLLNKLLLTKLNCWAWSSKQTNLVAILPKAFMKLLIMKACTILSSVFTLPTMSYCISLMTNMAYSCSLCIHWLLYMHAAINNTKSRVKKRNYTIPCNSLYMYQIENNSNPNQIPNIFGEIIDYPQNYISVTKI